MRQLLVAEQLLDAEAISKMEEHVKSIKMSQRTALLATLSLDNVQPIVAKWSSEVRFFLLWLGVLERHG